MRTDLELRQLRVFVTVVDVGSHTRAARELGVSQSTVSETMSSLERTLGTALFRKGGKTPVLTRSGEALLPYARRMIALAGEALAELARASTDVNARLVVAAVESLSAYVLPSRLAELRDRWPKTRLEVVTGACHEIRESVAAGKSDLGLVLEEEGSEGDEVLTRARLVVFGSPAHPFALARGHASADELRRCDFYLSDAGGSYHHALRHHFEVAGVPPPRTQSLGTIEGVKRGILAGGLALGLLPEHAVKDELKDGSLVEIALHPALPGLVLRAVVSPGGESSPVADALLDGLRRSTLASHALTARG